MVTARPLLRYFSYISASFMAFFFVACCFLFLTANTASATTNSNLHSDVPQDSHTKAQVAIIDNSAALICQIIGIDIVNPKKGCLGVDQKTGKIGYIPMSSTDTPQIGGMLGVSTMLLGSVYTPPASGTEYIASVVDNFGIVKKAYAQTSGFEALSPVQKIWTVSRNITYALLVLLFILLGLGIMLRVKIDPRTVMSIQNQVPRIVIAILLITFSYSIVGFMVDFMWLTTYVGINAVTSATSETIICGDGTPLSVQESAYTNLLNTPLAFMNDVLTHPEPAGTLNPSGRDCDLGIRYLSNTVSSTAGTFITTIMEDLFKLKETDCGFILTNAGCYAGNALARFVGWIGQVLMLLIVFLAILIVMIRLWWQLLKAYALIVFYTILGPFWILMGLLPNSERSFNSWMRTLTAKLMSFPAAAIMLVVARVILDNYGVMSANSTTTPSDFFIPPLVGNPNLGMLGPLLAFAILLIAPDILNMMNDAFKAPANKYVGPAITGGVAAGFAAGAPAGFLGRRAFKTDSHGGAVGSGAHGLRQWAQTPHDPNLKGFAKVRSQAKRAVGTVGSLALGMRTK